MELLFYIFGPIVALGALGSMLALFFLSGLLLATGRIASSILVFVLSLLALAAVTPVDVTHSRLNTYWPWPLVIAVFMGRVSYDTWRWLFPILASAGMAVLLLGYVTTKVVGGMWFVFRRIYGRASTTPTAHYVPPRAQ